MRTTSSSSCFGVGAPCARARKKGASAQSAARSSTTWRDLKDERRSMTDYSKAVGETTGAILPRARRARELKPSRETKNAGQNFRYAQPY